MIWKTDCYAKINLGLHVLDKLPNGYHEIETGFVFIDWRDELMLKPRPYGSTVFKTESELIPTDQSNLVMKAYELMREFYGVKGMYEITLNKRIPVGAGLGGGSSNTAQMIRMLNKIENLSLSSEILHEIASSLGSDVPVFLDLEPAIATGTGTTLKKVPIQPNAWILTIFPNIHSSTAHAYQNVLNYYDKDLPNLETILSEEPMDTWGYLLANNLEPAVISEHEIIGNLKDQLYDSGAVYASMSGSGSAVYGLFLQDFVALIAYETLLSLQFRCNLTKPLFQPDKGIYQLY